MHDRTVPKGRLRNGACGNPRYGITLRCLVTSSS